MCARTKFEVYDPLLVLYRTAAFPSDDPFTQSSVSERNNYFLTRRSIVAANTRGFNRLRRFVSALSSTRTRVSRPAAIERS